MPKKITFQEIKLYIESFGTIVLTKEEEYKNTKQNLNLKCQCGNIFSTSYHTIKHTNKHTCTECSYKNMGKNNKHSLSFVQKECQKRGATLISKEYKRVDKKIELKCSCGNHFYRTFEYVQTRKQIMCDECSVHEKTKHFSKTIKELWKDEEYRKQHSGKNAVRYNEELTDEERELKRRSVNDKEWRESVFERDAFTCKKCGDNAGGNLVAHHIDGWNWCKEKRYNIDNGVTLCEHCHKEFHRLYGYGNNTKEQFNEWQEYENSSNQYA